MLAELHDTRNGLMFLDSSGWLAWIKLVERVEPATFRNYGVPGSLGLTATPRCLIHA